MNPANTQWLAEAQFGMFYHFGLYTLLGGNENQVRETEGKAAYRRLLDDFNPVNFNAEEWVDCAISMGARYIVPTAKHAEGFCLWDSQLTDIKSTNTPFGRDLIAELAAASAKKGVKFCLYVNLETWLNDGDDVWNRRGMNYADFFEAQLTELLTQYGPIGVIWFDHTHPEIPLERFRGIVSTIKRLQPDCLVNDRGTRERPGDFMTPERQIPDYSGPRPKFIECCDAMGVDSWGYCIGGAFWSTVELAKRVSLSRSKGYNYLLNVEPAPDGSIRPECQVRAKGLGDWIEQNRPALNAGPCSVVVTDPNVQDQPPVGIATLAGSTLYLHLHEWPIADELLVKAVGTPRSASLDGKSLTTVVGEGGIRVGGLPPVPPAGHAPWIVTVELDGALEPVATAAPKVSQLVEGESLFLAPLDAELSSANGLLIPKINRFANGNIAVGSLHYVGDTLAWRAVSPIEGDFEVQANFGAVAVQAAASFELSNGTSAIRGTGWLTEHYSRPVRKSIGTLRLAQGENRIVLRVTEAPHEAFPDVHGITLIPLNQK